MPFKVSNPWFILRIFFFVGWLVGWFWIFFLVFFVCLFICLLCFLCEFVSVLAFFIFCVGVDVCGCFFLFLNIFCSAELVGSVRMTNQLNWAWFLFITFLDLCSTTAALPCTRKSSRRMSFYSACLQAIFPFFFCSLISQSFLLTPSINIYTVRHLILLMHLPKAAF